jgi:hypothetical protein
MSYKVAYYTMTDSLSQAIDNPAFQAFFYFIACVNVVYLVISDHLISVGLFLFTAICLIIYRKDTMTTLVVAMVICDLYYITTFRKEGFKKGKKKKGLGMKSQIGLLVKGMKVLIKEFK